MPESIQHKLDRVRRPRVQITYDVETLGSIVKTELPFVVGIMADLSGNSIAGAIADPKQVPLKDRKFVEIDRDNFNQIMEKIGPKVTLKQDGFTDELKLTSLDDFDPKNVLDKIPSLKGKFDSRTRLSNLVAKLDGNPQLQKDLMDALHNLSDEDKTQLQAYVTKNLHPPETPKVDGGTDKNSGAGGTTGTGGADSSTGKTKGKEKQS
jgi:type VI secretion system protein ImpB